MRFPFFVAAGFCLALVNASCTTTPVAVVTKDWVGPSNAGSIAEPTINESSGLAPSLRASDVYWTNNDSGGEPVLYAIDGTGRYLGSVRIAGAINYDWEDCASFSVNGKSYLLAADVGDNYAKRTDCKVYIIEEPDPAKLDPAQELTATIAWELPVAYPDGPRDCENVAVDPAERSIYFISKRTVPPVVYRLPLMPAKGTSTPLLELVGDLAGIPQPTGPLAMLETTQGKYRAMPCGFDISPDQRTAVVLTYGEVYIYNRAPGETWGEALAREPIQLAAHNLPQAEGVCFTSDNQTVIISTEGTPAPLLRYTRK
jgi:hypothetical protein